MTEILKEKRQYKTVPIEAVAKYWDARPCNIRHSSRPVGTLEYFQEVEKRKYFVEPHIPRFAAFERWKGRRVLEIGCGIGTDTMNFARAGAYVTAVDVSARSLEIARQRAQVLGLDNIRFFHADAERLADVVPPEPYDLVYSFGVLHHTPRPERIMAQLPNYMHQGSTLKIMVYHTFSWKVLWILMKYGGGKFWRLEELVARHSEAQKGCPVTYTFSRSKIRHLLEGFQITSLFVDHIFPYRIQDYVNYRYVKEWYWRWMPKPIFRVLERLAGWHLCVTARPGGEILKRGNTKHLHE